MFIYIDILPFCLKSFFFIIIEITRVASIVTNPPAVTQALRKTHHFSSRFEPVIEFQNNYLTVNLYKLLIRALLPYTIIEGKKYEAIYIFIEFGGEFQGTSAKYKAKGAVHKWRAYPDLKSHILLHLTPSYVGQVINRPCIAKAVMKTALYAE